MIDKEIIAQRYYTFVIPPDLMEGEKGGTAFKRALGTEFIIPPDHHYEFTWSAWPNELKGTYIDISLKFNGIIFEGIYIKIIKSPRAKIGKVHMILKMYKGSREDILKQAEQAKKTMKLFDFNICKDPKQEPEEKSLKELQQQVKDLWKKL